MGSPRRARLGLIAAVLILLTAWFVPGADAQAPAGSDTIPLTTTLEPGFNLVGWTQGETSVDAVFASIGPAATALFAWDATARRFRSARADGPAFLNDLVSLTPGQGFWAFIDGTERIEWHREVLASPPPLGLSAGLNLVGWAGPDGTPVAGALPDQVTAAWDFDPVAQQFGTFRPGQPVFLNSLEALSTGAGLWIDVAEASAWQQPGPASARVERGSMRFDGRQRTWRLYVPASLPLDEPIPLVIGLHGGLGSGEQFAESTRFDAQAEDGRFLAVYPDGAARPLLGIRTWNGGRCCGFAVERNIDDVGFIAALIDDLEATFRIDPQRIYAVGHSNGGIMAHRLACELPNRIAAIGVVAASLEVACEPDQPVSLLSIHGDADTSHPLEGGEGADSLAGVAFTSVQESLDTWIALNRCDPTPSVAQTGAVSTSRWSRCDQGSVIESQIVAGASHAWPGGEPTGPLRPQPSPDLDATVALWAFLSRQSR